MARSIKVHDLLGILERTLREYLSYDLAREVVDACEAEIIQRYEKIKEEAGMSEQYDASKHGGQQWEDFSPLLRPSWPTKHGYYDVIVSRRNHWWFEKGYYWTGSSWVTAHNNPCTNVIKYAPDTWKEDKA